MRNIPSFVLLRAFEAAARLQSFTLAAQELHLTPSAVSHQMKELEAYFGRSLFLRNNRRIEPLPEALDLWHSLSRVFDTIEQACAKVGLASNAHVLTVHCAPSLAMQWLGPRLLEFHQSHRQINLHLCTNVESIDLNHSREIDVSISYGSAPEFADIDVVPLGRERIVPLCSPSVLIDGMAGRHRMGELTLIDSRLSRVRWVDWFSQNNMILSTRPRPSFDRSALSIAAAVSGLGVALESTRLAERELKHGELVEISGEGLVHFEQETHFLSYRKSERHQEKVTAFRDWLLAKTNASGSDVGR